MIGPKIVSIILSLTLMPLFFWSSVGGESRARSVAPMDGESVTPGAWGGPHINMQVTEAGATIDYDCAHGTIEHQLMTDAEGRFQAKGFHYRERGGPEREDEGERGERMKAAAIYTGTTNGKTMTLMVKLVETQETIGTFTLAYGKTGRVTKCK